MDEKQFKNFIFLAQASEEVNLRNRCSIPYHAQPVWNDWMVGRVAGRLVALHIACNGVGESVAEVHPGVPETDACKGGRQVHLAPGEGQSMQGP